MKLWSLRLSVRTPGFQPGKRGSIPLGTTSFLFIGIKDLVMFAQLMNAQKISDKLSIGVSLLCVLHCLLFPSFLVIFSSFLSLTLDSELIHYILLFIVVPISIFALTVGLKNHNNSLVFFTGLVGIATLVSALFMDILIFSFSGEILLTIIGSAIISMAHYKNYKLCNHMDCDCHE